MEHRKLQNLIIEKLKTLSDDKRVLGAYIFGSVARNEFSKRSDMDVKVLVDRSDCTHVNHPHINGVKLDVTFMTYKQMVEMLDRQVAKRERIPMVAESIIIFDKTGRLKTLKKKYSLIKAPKYKISDYQGAIFLAQHFTDCIERNLGDDPEAALLGLHTNLIYLLEIRYRTLGRWQVGSKRLFYDIQSFDKPLSTLLERYLGEDELNKKFKLWLSIRDHVLKPLGGPKPIKELNCKCVSCRRFLKLLAQS